MSWNRLCVVAGVFAAGIALASAAEASVTFSDGTFPSANYAVAFEISSDASNVIGVSQCASCGNPGTALQILFSFPTGGGAFNSVNAIGMINSTFSYDPGTQGAIKSIDASTDKDISINVAQNYANFFHPLIEQGGNFYEATTAGPPLIAPGTTGFNTLSATGLTAADFLQVDPITGAVGSAHPDFAGGLMLFGFAQFTGSDAIPDTLFTAVYDNLDITLNQVPESATMSMMLVGLGAGLRLRRRQKARQEEGASNLGQETREDDLQTCYAIR